MDAPPSPAQVWLLRVVGGALVVATAVALGAMFVAVLLEGGRLGVASLVTGLAAFPVGLGCALLSAVRPSVVDRPGARD